MGARWLLAIAAALAVTSAGATDLTGITVVNADRRVNLKGQHVDIEETLTLRNTGQDNQLGSFLYCMPDLHVKKIAYLAVTHDKDEKLAYQTRKPEPVIGIEPAQQSGNTCFQLPLGKQLAKQATGQVTVHVVLTKAQFPRPAKVAQNEPQRVLWETTLYLQTPYPVEKQKLKLDFKGEIIKYTDAPPVKKTNRAVEYGPYEDIDTPFANYWIKFHYVNNAPFAAATELTRELEVSHWGNIYVEEQYQLTHYGAKLTGSWSRHDYTTGEEFRQSSFRDLSAVMPLRARSVYFRDAIGNVSSSQLIHTPYSTEALLLPRYPLFGGWSTDFVFGYSLPLSPFVSRGRKGVLTLTATLGPAVRNLVVDKLIVKVVLPEGAYDITEDLPIDVSDISYETKYTYLDTHGRPVLVIEMDNMVDEAGGPFQVHYKMRPFAAFREPALLIGSVALVFALVIGWLRLDLTITRDAKWAAGQRQAQATALLQRILLLISERRRGLTLLEKTAEGGDGAALASVKSSVEDKLRASTEKLRQLAKEFEGVASGRGAGLKELLEKERALQSAAAQLAARKQQLLADGKDVSEVQQATEGQERAVAAQMKEVTAMADGLLEDM